MSGYAAIGLDLIAQPRGFSESLWSIQSKEIVMPIPKLRDVSSASGAPMGRPNSITENHKKLPLRFYLVRLPFVGGCYDKGGAYWGAPTNMWRAESGPYQNIEGYEVVQELFFRAPDRSTAKTEVRRTYPNAEFFK